VARREPRPDRRILTLPPAPPRVVAPPSLPSPGRARRVKSAQVLREILAPVSVSRFARRSFERAPLALPATPVRHRLMGRTGATLEALIAAAGRNPKAVTRIPLGRRSARDAALPLAAYLARARGSALLTSTHEWMPGIARLAREFENAFGCHTGVNAYLTPPGEQTFLRHWDHHDVFLLQVAGRKRWRVHVPLERFPLQPSRTPADSACLLEVTLEPGALLYIPRGFPHEGVAGDDGASAHLTVGLYAVTGVELLESIFRQALMAAREDPAQRAPLYRPEVLAPGGAERELSRMLRRITRYFEPRSLRELYRLSELNHARLRVPLAAPRAPRGERYRLSSLACVVQRGRGSDPIRLLLPDRQLVLPALYAAAWDRIARGQPVDGDQLTRFGLDAREVRHLLSTLAEAGLLHATGSVRR
jgi:hypothetical protein